MKLRTFCCVAVVTILPWLEGCSEGPVKTVRVYGKVTFADRTPPTSTEIVFQPVKVEGPKRPSITELEPDGTYQVKAFQNSKGLIPGTYHILLNFHEPKPGGNLKAESGWKHTNYDAGEVDVAADSSGVEHNIEVTTQNKKG